MYTLFAIGSFWFWTLIVITFGLLTGYVNRNKEDDGVISTVVFVLAIVAFFFLGNHDLFFNLIEFIKSYPLTFIGYIAGYLFIGSVWSFVKWYYYLVDCKNKYIEDKLRYPTTSSKLRVPEAKDHKGDIIMWMSYWIVSIFWTLINKWVVKIWTTIFYRFEGLYNKLSNNIFKDLVNEEAKEEVEKKTTK